MQYQTGYANKYRICKNMPYMQKHTVYAKTYSICNNIQYMQIIEYMQKHKQYAKQTIQKSRQAKFFLLHIQYIVAYYAYFV